MGEIADQAREDVQVRDLSPWPSRRRVEVASNVMTITLPQGCDTCTGISTRFLTSETHLLVG